MPDRIKAPAIKNPDEFEITLPPCDSFTLKNGAPVYFVNGGAEDVMKIEWVFSAGNCYEDRPAVASAVNRLLKAGTTRLTAYELSKHFEFYGAFLSTACFNEHAVVTLEVLTKHIREVLPVVSEIFAESVFPDNEIQVFVKNSSQRLKVNLRKCEFVANQHIGEMLYGAEHPYGKKTTIADLKALDQSAMIAFYEHFYKDAECKIFAAGRLPQNFRQIMDNYFGDLKLNAQKALPGMTRQPATEKIQRLPINDQGVQAAIRIARQFPQRKDPDFKPAMVLNALLGGYFGSRLMSNIREDKGYTYGIYSFIQAHLRASSWMVSTEAGVDVAEATVTEIFKELAQLQETAASQEEMRLVKNYLIGHQLASLDGPFNIIGRWKSLVLNEVDEEFFYETIDVIKSVTAKDLQALAIKYFDPEAFYQLTVV